MGRELGRGTVLVEQRREAPSTAAEILAEMAAIRVRTVGPDGLDATGERTAYSDADCVVLTPATATGTWEERVRAAKSMTPPRPVVVVVAETVPGLAERALRLGVDGYVNLAADAPADLRTAVGDAISTVRRRRQSMLADHAGDPMYLLDGDNRLVACNRAACELLGERESALVGRSFGEFVALNAVDHLEEQSPDGEQDGVTVDVNVRPTAGESVPCELSVTPIPTGAEARELAVAVARDMAERRRATAALEAKNDRLEEFASLVAHDLRNPLSIAIGRLEVVGDEYESDHLDAIDDAHRRIEDIIANLLSLARTGSVEGGTTAVSVEQIAADAWDSVETGDATLDIAFEHRITANASRLQQLFENLFRNAVEHTEGTPAVSIGPVEAVQTSTRRVEGVEPAGFYVADDGPGIPAENRASVFDYGESDSDAGNGFGLAIVRDIVTEHEWDIHVTTSATGGAAFEITGTSIATAGR
ncbi:two-component system sensor histidine kinase NtrB [Haloarcula onubensis]|uniref:histidine kinase n=1 Tax=Haloarcula onubensis TaxID=2950539 RepID=A0ABU2FKA9_9EURY|nr:PAS domain-containing sensor histidine kinase [Halomicroarcula sp. S3CR25-11]MDS0281190.1 PAS domain-containing sensor histidine kinase [Halomicroarcula sp. S3CR25-11]